jgi:hypothetical protein
MIHLAAIVLLDVLLLSNTQASTQSALAADPKGWVDLLGDKSLKDWVRVPLGPVGQLRAGQTSEPSPWKLDGETLICEGDKSGHEMFRYGPEVGDFILHVEWRFTKLEGEPRYNSGVFVKASADGSSWIQAQTGSAVGHLFGNIRVNDKPQRFNLQQKVTENRVKPAGEWNTYEIKSAGKNLSLWVNGATVNEYPECEIPLGYIGLEAEGFRIEFRNLKIKPGTEE